MRFSKKKYPLFLITVLFFAVVVKCCIRDVFSANRIFVYAYPVYRQYSVERITKKLQKCGCNCINVNDNIRVYWDRVEPKTIETIVGNVERCLKSILKDLECNIEGRTEIAVLSQNENIKTVLDGHDVGFCMGAYFRGMVLIFDPSLWMECCDDFNEVFLRDGPLVHELTHCIVDYKTNGNKPAWFSEGIALLEEHRINNTLGKYGGELSDYYCLDELQHNFWELEQAKAYTQSFNIVSFVADNFGMRSISDIMDELGKGMTMEKSVKNILGMTLQELFDESLNL